jgi:serine protease Do
MADDHTTDETTTAPDVLGALETAARSVSERVSAATVSIGRNGRGSGVVVARDRVLTNAHNLRDRTTSVTFADGRSVQGTVQGADAHGDLVLLDADTGDVTPVEWSDVTPSVGTIVFAVSGGSRGTRIGFGLVSGVDRTFRGPRGRKISGGLEHSAPLARGSSGGPVVDREGRLLGINTHRLGEGFYLAQPTDDTLRTRIDRMDRGEFIERPTLGIAVAPPEVANRLRASVGLPDAAGVLVRQVSEGSPAERAGVRTGDLIVGAGDRSVRSVDELFEVLDDHDPAAELVLHLVRGADDAEVSVSFGTDDASADTTES